MMDWLNQTEWLGNSLYAWGMTTLGVVLAFIVVRLGLVLFGKYMAWRTRNRPKRWLDAISRALSDTHGVMLASLIVLVALRFLEFPPTVSLRLGQLLFLLVGVQLAIWVSRVLVELLDYADRNGQSAHNAVIFGILRWAVQLVIWSVVLLAAMDNAGINVNAFIASLGIGGIAVALAAQAVLGDLLASLSIGLDKPFEVGDSIGFGSASGTVERVGIKSSRIRTSSGEEISIGNAVLMQGPVSNFSRLRERRVVLSPKLALDAPRAEAMAFLEQTSALIGGIEKVRLERGHLIGIGESSLDFEFVYRVLDPGFDLHRDIQQRISLGMMEIVEQLRLQWAAPRRVLQSSGRMDGAAAGD